MKTLLHHTFIVALLFAAITVESSAQITITREMFPRQKAFTDTAYLSKQGGLAVPSEGSAQVWDYSSVASSSLVTTPFFDASGEAGFSNALTYSKDDLTFQGMLIPNNLYEAISTDAWFEVGWKNSFSGNSIIQITGGAKDSLNFPASTIVFDGRIDKIKFPMTYSDEWTETQIQITNFELTVASFGLDRAPGLRKRFFTEHRKVTGYGRAILPNPSGGAGAVDVLQIKVEVSVVDSIFLGGSPAPAPLMTAFGLTQGGVATQNYYVFYTNNFGSPVFNVNLSPTGQASSIYYRPQATTPIASVEEVLPVAATAICFPNPARAGERVTIHAQHRLAKANNIALYDVEGKEALSIPFHANSDRTIGLTLPEKVAPGVYYFRLDGNDGEPVQTGTLLIVE